MERRADNSKMYKYGNGSKTQLAWKCFGVQFLLHKPDQHSYWGSWQDQQCVSQLFSHEWCIFICSHDCIAHPLASAHGTSESGNDEICVINPRDQKDHCKDEDSSVKLTAGWEAAACRVIMHLCFGGSRHPGRGNGAMDRDRRVGARGGTWARVRKKEVMATAQGKYAPIIRAILKSA